MTPPHKGNIHITGVCLLNKSVFLSLLIKIKKTIKKENLTIPRLALARGDNLPTQAVVQRTQTDTPQYLNSVHSGAQVSFKDKADNPCFVRTVARQRFNVIR
ncbi:hypothetical protein EAE90_14485 [Photorhabdus caribbeanensis]|nr:hypothetical protein [Photorhabdus caribbeanensis]